MKVVTINQYGQLEDGSIPKPIPKDHEVLIHIKASGFNPIDYQMLENEHERKLISSPILGRELAGIVVDKGTQVFEFQIGDEVFCASGSMGSNGTYAEFITVPEAIVVLKLKKISFEEAAAIPSAALTALQICNRLQISPKDTILITGATGGVGSFLVKILVAHKIKNIMATVGREESTKLLLNMGLKENQIVNYKLPNLRDNLLKANNNQPFDIGIDLVGNEMAEITAELLKINGTYVDVTFMNTTKSRETLFNKGISILNISNYAHSVTKNYAYYKDNLQHISKLIQDGTISPPSYKIVGKLSTETVLEAHRILKNNQTKGNKLIMIHE